MLDVHAPEHSLHTKREFFLHLFTITIGLFIALSLENAAEWLHHMHQRREADANITSEIRDNRQELTLALKADHEAQASLLRSVAFLKAHAEGKPFDTHNIELGMTLADMEDASWQTAGANGALSYMEYAHVKRYSAVYKLQNEFLKLQDQTVEGFLQIQSYLAANDDPTKLSAADSDKARVDVLQALAHLVALQQIGGALLKQYDQALKAD